MRYTTDAVNDLPDINMMVDIHDKVDASDAGTDGTACAGDAYACTADVCNSSGGCTHPVKAGYCIIGGKCYPKGQGGG